MASDISAQFKRNWNLIGVHKQINKNTYSTTLERLAPHWHFIEHIMGRKFLLAFFTLSAFFFMLHARADGSPANSEPNSLNLRSRTLLQNPEPEKSIADPPAEMVAPLSAEKADDDERDAAAEAPTEWESRKIGRHHSPDKSVAGGGVIIGGLVTAIFAAVYCYIRVTRRRPAETLTWIFLGWRMWILD